MEFNIDDFNVDIFDEMPEREGNYVKFEKVGDSVQGTYIKRNDNSIDGYGNHQTLISLKKADGEVVTVSIRHNKTGLLKMVDEAKLGEIVGFKFNGTKENPGRQPTKFILFAHSPNIVDKQWLTENAGKFPNMASIPTSTNGEANVVVPGPNPVATSAPAPSVDSTEDKIAQIYKIAKEKLGATDEMSIKSSVMEKTGLAFIPINLDLILERLKNI